MAGSKSARHSKFTGDFGEIALLYALSFNGFECAQIDHTGIDLIAAYPKELNCYRIGISVKTRSRIAGSESQSITFTKRDTKKAEAACKSFGLEPYAAFVVDTVEDTVIYLLPVSVFCKYRDKYGYDWKMSRKHRDEYQKDASIAVIPRLGRGPDSHWKKVLLRTMKRTT